MRPQDLPYNPIPPRIMHVDLNSCFAIIEQQANRLLRGKPVGVAAYDTPRGFVLAASYEAKRLGIKLGVTVGQAKLICPDIVIMTPDPAKYREAHRRFKDVLLAYTSDVIPKSIDEFVVDFNGSPALRAGHTMAEIGYEIKDRIREHLGEAVTVNVGIGPNRFLAKLAAGLHKPDGLDEISHENLEATLKDLELIDLPGINVRYNARLQSYGIKTPLEFLAADSTFLHKVVFRSIVGHYWYLRLRGYEIDAAPTLRRSIGHQYALSRKTSDKTKIARLLMKLCEKTGRRLRKNNLYASGIALYMPYEDRNYFAHSHKVESRLYSTYDIYHAALRLLGQADITADVRGISVTVFGLHPWNPEQLNIFQDYRTFAADKRLSDAMDRINSRYGEFVVTPADMADMRGTILDRIAFGAIRDME